MQANQQLLRALVVMCLLFCYAVAMEECICMCQDTRLTKADAIGELMGSGTTTSLLNRLLGKQ